MDFAKNDWVWIDYRKQPRLGLVLAVREHTVILRIVAGQSRRLRASREVVSKRIIVKAELSREELEQLPCGKRPLILGRAQQIVAVNKIFTDDPNRKERRVYYCRRCKAFHTTGQFKIHVEILKKLAANPYTPLGIENYADGRSRKRVWLWLRDIIGIKVSYRIFDLSLPGYGDDSKEIAVSKIVIDPLNYLHYLFLFTYQRRQKDKQRNR